MDAKYVVVEIFGLETMIVFSPWIEHKAMMVLGPPVSAGFVGRNKDTKSGFYVYGQSASLALSHRLIDQVLLNILFGEKE